MKVYSVFKGVNYEGGYIAGVFASEELALKFVTNNQFTKVHCSAGGTFYYHESDSARWSDSYCEILPMTLDEEIPIT